MSERLVFKNDRLNLREQRRRLVTSSAGLLDDLRTELYPVKPIETIDTQKSMDMHLMLIQQIEEIREIDAKLLILNRKLEE